MAAGDLCTLSDVKAWANIQTTANDAVLTRLITAASQAIKTWLARPLLQDTYTQKYDGTGINRLTLRNFPITAVSSLAVDGLTVPPAPAPNVGFGYMFDEFGLYLVGGDNHWSTVPQTPNIWAGSYFPRGSQNVTVTYTAGYASVPVDVTQACIELVAFKYQQRNHVGVSSRTLTAGGESVVYQQAFMPPEVKALLDVYRKVVPS